MKEDEGPRARNAEGFERGTSERGTRNAELGVSESGESEVGTVSSLPRSAFAVPRSDGPSSDLPRPRVLLVDDEKSIRVTLGALLGQAGFDVVPARDGREALRMIEERAPDVVVTDIVMPEEDGLGLIRQLHTRFPEIPFVVMSGATFANNFHLSMAKAFGAASVLRKPFDSNELVEVLRRIVAERPSRGTQEA